MKRYAFYDVPVSLQIPDDLQAQWDLLYGRFAAGADSGGEAVQIEINPVSSEVYGLRAGAIEREIPSALAMMHLQDIVQNHLLSSVSSHGLFHGACWNVNGKGVMLLAESGVGKSTLSLAFMKEGGEVLSDEIAGWHFESNRLHSFPRSLAVLPETINLCDVNQEYPSLELDEEKVIIPPGVTSVDVPLDGIVILEGQQDDIDAEGSVCELSVAADNDLWIKAMMQKYQDVEIVTHPDREGWWRCLSSRAIKAADLHEYLSHSHAILTGYHRGAYRSPDYSRSPVIEEVDVDAAAEAALSHLVNARHLAQLNSPVKLMGQIRAMAQQAKCFRCVPGKLSDTLKAITSLFPRS